MLLRCLLGMRGRRRLVFGVCVKDDCGLAFRGVKGEHGIKVDFVAEELGF